LLLFCTAVVAAARQEVAAAAASATIAREEAAREEAAMEEAAKEEAAREDVLGAGCCWPQYRIVGADITDLPVVARRLANAGLDTRQPTLFLSECVLTYVGVEDTAAVLRWCREAFTDAIFVTYEQIHPDDTFGRFMQAHFTKLGSTLKAIRQFPTEESHRARFRDLGWPAVTTCDMGQFFSQELTDGER